MKTYGIYAVKVKGINVKDDKDNGWVADVKWAFMTGVTVERKFTLEHMPVLKGAAAENGRIKLEVTPMLEGQALPAVYLPVHLRGNITIDEDGAVLCVTRVTFDELETAGMGVDNILNSVNCLECRVSDQPTLEEQIQQELKAENQLRQDVNDLLADVPPLLAEVSEQTPELSEHETPEQFLAGAHFGQLSTLLQAIGFDPTDWDDPKSSDDQDAAEWRALLLKDWDKVVASGALEGMYEPAEPDMPFPPSSTDNGQQPSA